MKGSTIEYRHAKGRAVREHMKRSAHRQIGDLSRDPLAPLREQAEHYAPRLVALHHGRMAVSPLAFFLGSAALHAHDLSRLPHTGMLVPLCGNAHLLNFCGFVTAGRELAFEVDAFDEAAIGPWEWDVKRLAVSLVLAARQRRLSSRAAEELVLAAVAQYRDRMRQYAQYGAVEMWHETITFDHMIESALAPEARRAIRRALEKGAAGADGSAPGTLVDRTAHGFAWRNAPPTLFRAEHAAPLFAPDEGGFEEGADWRSVIEPMWEQYRETLAHDRRALLDQFTLQDLAFQIEVENGANRDFVLLCTDHHDKPLFLQARESHPSAIARYVDAGSPRALPARHDGERVAMAQHLLQATRDVFAGWTARASQRPFHVREWRDRKLAANVDLFDSMLLESYARLCGWALARAHAKASGEAIEIAAYMGRSDQFPQSLAAYARVYADKAEHDYDVFLAACRSGKLETQSENDVAAGVSRTRAA
ncbi:DUF2252 domain-containing protein [Paraburkholderia kururiensis]|uniref:DUF2252 domain-containing protein n=1 Tax=Paraburkholderia kururiensis TaxID=984307 RepID=UPI00034D1FEA|nr:DUF2252 domain-containing protein [Paraburkholderia kururiensis]